MSVSLRARLAPHSGPGLCQAKRHSAAGFVDRICIAANGHILRTQLSLSHVHEVAWDLQVDKSEQLAMTLQQHLLQWVR